MDLFHRASEDMCPNVLTTRCIVHWVTNIVCHGPAELQINPCLRRTGVGGCSDLTICLMCRLSLVLTLWEMGLGKISRPPLPVSTPPGFILRRSSRNLLTRPISGDLSISGPPGRLHPSTRPCFLKLTILHPLSANLHL